MSATRVETLSTPRMLTPLELAQFLKVSPATIRRRLHIIPHVRVGNRVRFVPEDVVQFLRERRKI